MKTVLLLPALVLLITVFANPCSAFMPIDQVTRERAKELGMEIRVNGAGPSAVRVELEFELKGEMKSFVRVDMEMRDGDKWVWATLQEDRSKPGRVIVSFAADRTALDAITLRVVTGVPRDMVGYDLRMRDFVEPAKPH